MAIAKKPNRSRSESITPTKQKAADAFIAGAEPEGKAQGRERKIPILIRFDPTMLQQVDKAARRRGISRSAWVHFMVSRALEQEEN